MFFDQMFDELSFPVVYRLDLVIRFKKVREAPLFLKSLGFNLSIFLCSYISGCEPMVVKT